MDVGFEAVIFNIRLCYNHVNYSVIWNEKQAECAEINSQSESPYTDGADFSEKISENF